MSSTKLWVFSGSVYVGGQLAVAKWQTETWATSERKARNNLQYRYRRDNQVPFGTNVHLHGTFKEVS